MKDPILDRKSLVISRQIQFLSDISTLFGRTNPISWQKNVWTNPAFGRQEQAFCGTVQFFADKIPFGADISKCWQIIIVGVDFWHSNPFLLQNNLDRETGACPLARPLRSRANEQARGKWKRANEAANEAMNTGEHMGCTDNLPSQFSDKFRYLNISNAEWAGADWRGMSRLFWIRN